LTLSLSRDIGRVLGEKEKIRFAVQDVTRTSVLSEQAVAAAIDDMNKRAESEATAMQQGRERLEVLAAKAQDASPENRAAAMAEFKEAYRNYTRVSYRHKMLVGTATNHRSLLQGIGAVRRGFEAVGGNMQDVFDRIEDSGELLSFAAGIRKETADLLGQYRRILGDGAGSMREMMDTLRSIQGQMRILSTLSENLDTASSFTAIVKDMEDFSKTLVPEGATSLVPTGDDFWAQKVSEIAWGRFFQQKPPVVGDK
jgi:methyl-accepting chemotaxis protein